MHRRFENGNKRGEIESEKNAHSLDCIPETLIFFVNFYSKDCTADVHARVAWFKLFMPCVYHIYTQNVWAVLLCFICWNPYLWPFRGLAKLSVINGFDQSKNVFSGEETSRWKLEVQLSWSVNEERGRLLISPVPLR